MRQNKIVADLAVDSDKQKSGKGWKITAVIAFTAAVCGVGFGIYGILQSLQKDYQVSELKIQIESLNKKMSSLGINNENITKRAEDSSSAVMGGNLKDYIFVGELGFKIKKPENWRDLVGKYVYHNDYPHAVDTFEIMENENVATSHAMISPGNGNCKDDEWTDCIEVKLGEESILDVRVPKSNSDSVSKSFRNWVTNSDNYSKIYPEKKRP